MNINEVIAMPEYSFLFEHERLGRNVMLVTFGGSYAYGTNNMDSDIDIRGITLPRREDIISPVPHDIKSGKKLIMGPRGFEQYNDTETDTVIYSLDKMVRLLYENNPNTVEILGCRPQDYAMVSEEGRMLLDNGDIFLSKQAYRKFTGYSRQQLFRLKNALARNSLSTAEKSVHLIDAVEQMYRHLEETYCTFNRDSIKLYLTDLDGNRIAVAGNPVTLGDVELIYVGDTCEQMLVAGREIDPEKVEIRADVDINGIRLEDLAGVYGEVSSVVKNYNSHKGHRNNKKDAAHINKHAMHLIRASVMLTDILKDHRVVTYRKKEHDMLMSIRNGEYMKPDGSYDKRFFKMVDNYGVQIEKLYEKTTLPDLPDEKRIRQMVTDIRERIIQEGK